MYTQHIIALTIISFFGGNITRPELGKVFTECDTRQKIPTWKNLPRYSAKKMQLANVISQVMGLQK
jgi:hypothetical protein